MLHTVPHTQTKVTAADVELFCEQKHLVRRQLITPIVDGGTGTSDEAAATEQAEGTDAEERDGDGAARLCAVTVLGTVVKALEDAAEEEEDLEEMASVHGDLSALHINEDQHCSDPDKDRSGGDDDEARDARFHCCGLKKPGRSWECDGGCGKCFHFACVTKSNTDGGRKLCSTCAAIPEDRPERSGRTEIKAAESASPAGGKARKARRQ